MVQGGRWAWKGIRVLIRETNYRIIKLETRVGKGGLCQFYRLGTGWRMNGDNGIP